MKFSSSSAYSFGKSTKGKLDKTDLLTNPGPGAYKPEIGIVKRDSPHWKIGTAERSKKIKENSPGPGQYRLNTSSLSGPMYSMRLKTQNFADPLKYNVSPGPANYKPNFNTLYRNFSYTMRPRSNITKKDSYPGPGNYDLRTDKSLIAPTYVFGTEKKLQPMLTSNRFSPGPGNYKLNTEAGAQAPKFSFGKENRTNSQRPRTPGPGAYDLKTRIGNEGPKITISSWRPLTSMVSSANGTPGPGQYKTNLYDKPNPPSYRIGSAKRTVPNKNAEFPGPGTYNALNMSTSFRVNSPTWSMGKSLRGNLSNSSILPGPGNYDFKSKLGEGPKYSLRGKYDTNKRPETPGPGLYQNDTQKHLHKNPSWRIGTSTREDVLKRTMKENVPGPGNYKYSTEKTMPSFSFGTEARDKKINSSTPGPGQYHIPSSMVDVPRYLSTGGGFSSSYRYI